MMQLLQNLKTGKVELLAAPAPRIRAGTLLIDSSCSLISTGTERMLVDFSKAGLISKARQQPEKVKQVLAKIKTDGLFTTIDAVNSKLDQPLPLGYCNVGVVKTSAVDAFKPGDRVVSNGPHADVVCVPANLCAKIPEGVSDEEAAFAIPASIGLQGIRLAEPTLGECFAVFGAGLIGLLTIQILLAHGCKVLAIDFDKAKLEVARGYGASICNLSAGEDPIALGRQFSGGRGVDGVLIAASTKSSDPVSQAASMCRKRGRIVLVGVTGLELKRADFYEKELRFQVSCSYGPGRYDPLYEERGQDYPFGFVRWTEQRNFEAVLDLFAARRLSVEGLVSNRFVLHDAAKAYETLSTDRGALGIMLQYPHAREERHVATVRLKPQDAPLAVAGSTVLGVIGAGNYASRILIPAFKLSGAVLHTLVAQGGTNSAVHGNKAGFANASSDEVAVFENAAINAIAIATRHDSHARLAATALKSGKHVFVEKPLALTYDELSELEITQAASSHILMVGFNRRFAPQVKTMKRLLDSTPEPKVLVMVMNAGALPADHWTQDIVRGGGRIIGEACHHVDLMRHLVGRKIKTVQAQRLGGAAAGPEENAVIMLGFDDGSMGTIHYLANGSNQFPKERVEVFVAGRTLQLDNFTKLTGFGWPGFRSERSWRQDKGQTGCAKAFVDAVTNGTAAPIAAEELFEVTRATLDAAQILRKKA